MPVRQTRHAIGIVTVNPVPQGLPIHAGQTRRVRALAPVQNKGQAKQPANHRSLRDCLSAIVHLRPHLNLSD